jgi:hypothetical protein
LSKNELLENTLGIAFWAFIFIVTYSFNFIIGEFSIVEDLVMGFSFLVILSGIIIFFDEFQSLFKEWRRKLSSKEKEILSFNLNEFKKQYKEVNELGRKHRFEFWKPELNSVLREYLRLPQEIIDTKLDFEEKIYLGTLIPFLIAVTFAVLSFFQENVPSITIENIMILIVLLILFFLILLTTSFIFLSRISHKRQLALYLHSYKLEMEEKSDIEPTLVSDSIKETDEEKRMRFLELYKAFLTKTSEKRIRSSVNRFDS